MKFGSCMCFLSSSFTVGLLFRIARNDDEILGFSPDQCYGICCCAVSSTFIKFKLQKDFFEHILEGWAQDDYEYSDNLDCISLFSRK